MIRVLIWDDVEFTSDLIVTALAGETDVQIIGTQAEPGKKVGHVVEADVILTSVREGDDRALRSVRVITEADPGAQILVLGLDAPQEEINRYLEAGASDYVRARDSLDQLVSTVYAAYRRKIGLRGSQG